MLTADQLAALESVQAGVIEIANKIAVLNSLIQTHGLPVMCCRQPIDLGQILSAIDHAIATHEAQMHRRAMELKTTAQRHADTIARAMA